MSDEPDRPPIDVDLSKGRVILRDAYNDVRPLIITTVDGLNSALRLVANAIGIPADWANPRLERFREKLRSGAAAIPVEFQQDPPFRITYKVLSETVIAAEETELQDLFANLLLTACDSRTSSDAHPGFANTIAQLTPFDAEVISELALKQSRMAHWDANERWPDRLQDFNISCQNLLRLGVVEPVFDSVSAFFGSQSTTEFNNVQPQGLGGFGDRHVRQIAQAAETFAEKVKEEFDKSKTPIAIQLTDFGRLFASACLRDHATPEHH